MVVKTRTTQVCVRKGGNIHPWCPSEILRRPENSKVCVRKGGNIYPWCPSEILQRPENSKVCVLEKGNTYPRCLSVGREDPAIYVEIADLTDRADTKRSQISAIGRPRDRRFDSDRALTQRYQISVWSLRLAITQIPVIGRLRRFERSGYNNKTQVRLTGEKNKADQAGAGYAYIRVVW